MKHIHLFILLSAFIFQLAACASPNAASNVITNVAAATVMPSPTPTQTPLPMPRLRIDNRVQMEYRADASDLASAQNGSAFAWTRKDWDNDKQFDVYSGAVFIPAYNLVEQRPLDANHPIAIAVESKQERVVLGSAQGEIEIWNARTGMRDQVLGQVNGKPVSIALNQDETLAAVGADGYYQGGLGSVTIFDKEKNTAPIVLSAYGAVTRVRFAPNNQLYYATNANSCGRGGGGVFAWQRGQTRAQLIFTTNGNPVRDIAVHPQGNLIASVGTNSAMRCIGTSVVSVWNTTDAKITRVFTPTNQIENESPQTLDAYSVAFSPDGNFLAIGDALGRVQVWDWQAGQVLATSDMDSTQTTHIVFLTNHLLAYFTLDGYVRLFSF